MKTNHLKSLILFLILSMCCITIQAQKDNRENPDHFHGKLDVGLNVTSVISSFSGNGNFLEPENLPFLLRFGKKSNVRLGFGLQGSSDDFFDDITGSFRESSEQEVFVKLGFQNSMLVEGKWDFYVGADVLGQYLNDEVTINGQVDAAKISQRTIGMGMSPFAGIKFYLGQRIYLSTEANFTFLYAQKTLSESDPFGPGQIVVKTNAEAFSVSPPLFLYLNYQL